MFTPSLPHIHFFHFSNTCYLGSNGSTKFLDSIVVFIPFRRANLAVVPKSYEGKLTPHCPCSKILKLANKLFLAIWPQIWFIKYFVSLNAI